MAGQSTFLAACVQMCSGLDPAANVTAALELIKSAAASGAHLIMTPEMTNVIDPDRARLYQKVGSQSDDAAVAAFSECARQTATYLLAGSFALRNSTGGLVNRSLLFGPDGHILAHYDKMHMFDVDLPNGERYRESATYSPGDRAVVVPTGLGLLGLSVCYDLRFAALYRALAQGGAQFLAIPSAFTRPTGEAHWQVLLRARAIESGSYVFAPAQTGEHQSGRKTYGHSMIVAPWGEVVAEAHTEPGVILAQIDPEMVTAARQRIPSLDHDRLFSTPFSSRRAKIT